eukprot:maker-scaffold15_size728074-snap-gene-1.10 protein:Tk08841 transcript:maker-scaffold15_size728074-snap-gene-1.10-mRNA-1 annotation:"e-selectin precursor"
MWYDRETKALAWASGHPSHLQNPPMQTVMDVDVHWFDEDSTTLSLFPLTKMLFGYWNTDGLVPTSTFPKTTLTMSRLLTLALFMSLLTFAHCQFGFLGNIFGGGRGRDQRPPPPQFQRGPPPQTFNNGGGGGGGCPSSSPNYNFGGKSYLLSWRLGCRSFGGDQAAAYCRQNGMQPISFESEQEVVHFTNLVAQEREKYFWTGGRMTNGHSTISWASGSNQPASSLGTFWGPTGGAGQPQPDNREGNEFCVAVLNNFYDFQGRGEGQKFHDVSCHHEKPVICEN